MNRHQSAAIAILALGLVMGPSAAFAQKLEAIDLQESSPGDQTSVWAIPASFVPGLLVHGSGSFVAGDTESAKNLLIMEGIGVGLLLTSAATIMFTGAAEQTSSAAIGLAVLGTGLFTTSALADIYAVTTPDGGFGSAPQDLPLLEASSGYQYVYNPALQDRHYLSLGAQLRYKEFDVEGRAWINERASGHRVQGSGVWHIMGNSADKLRGDKSFFGIRLGYTNDTTVELTASNLVEAEVVSRLDLGHLGPGLDGSFVDLSVGYGRGWLTYVEVDEKDSTSLLLGRFAFGMYIGEGNEAAFFYDHRHDGFAGGLKLNGKASGFGGNVGLSLDSRVWEDLGIYAEVAAGSAFVGNIGLRYGWK